MFNVIMGGNFQEGVMFVFAMNNEHLLPAADVIFHITNLRRKKVQDVQKKGLQCYVTESQLDCKENSLFFADN